MVPLALIRRLSNGSVFPDNQHKNGVKMFWQALNDMFLRSDTTFFPRSGVTVADRLRPAGYLSSLCTNLVCSHFIIQRRASRAGKQSRNHCGFRSYHHRSTLPRSWRAQRSLYRSMVPDGQHPVFLRLADDRWNMVICRGEPSVITSPGNHPGRTGTRKAHRSTSTKTSVVLYPCITDS